MDFTLGEDLEAVRDLARQIFADHAAQERIKAAEQSGTGLDAALWTALADAGLLGVALPESAGGAGLGVGGLAVLLEEQGRTVAPVPVWPAVVAALTLAEHGTAAQRDLLPALVDGGERLTVALEEFGAADPAEPRCTAVRDGDGWRLTGVKAVVPAPSGASHVLVSARSDEGSGLYLAATSAAGTSWEPAGTTAHDGAAHLTLDGTPAQALGDEALASVLRLARVALAAVQVGVAEGALRLAADHLTGREQFGRPLAAFQAVQHQLADCYIEIDAMRVCLWHAVSLISAGQDAESAVLVAKWWSDEGGLNVVHRVQHLHGGIGVDVDYPVHRHFLWGKQISGTLGGASADLELLGAAL
ncbi:acyl-CoA dehydrogenase family protein [Actinomadura sp. 7K534]|uniref:acyl-CoA dehydrogenase family protein n=1 Tax=Actinomadura sp. 7K534 TaxID=2530366 RepID=UPI001043D09B|nr:acyl-CoA dehydrogenase family protein [Actinomadura sp. 7K534]TDB97829.1 acyl-CoA dehydrogenase [Actinomadura sp. 7K534]